jgi:metal-responsive CopG/Arc/MetJ family transcriptional regulator
MPEPQTELVNVSLRIPRDLLEALDREAAKLDRSSPNRSQVVRRALEQQLFGNRIPKPEEVPA